MTQYKAIPQATDQRNQSQVDILNNFNYLNSQSVAPNNGIILVDHLATGDNGLSTSDGFHKQVSLLNRATPANLTNAVNAQNSNGIAYTQNDTAPTAPNPQLHFYNGVNDWQITPSLPIRAYANFDGRITNGLATINSSFNVTSVTRTATGFYTVVFPNNMPSLNYVFQINGSLAAGIFVGSLGPGVFVNNNMVLVIGQLGAGSLDPQRATFIIYGG
jgi:hypothetical protein